jgi:monovalent cation:H+ antiporter-2, CPA2 family
VVRTMLSGLVAWIAGHALDWPLASILLFALLLTFNSTAVVSEFLKKHGELHSYHGKIVLNILLLQDILLAPVLSGFQLLGDHQTNGYRLGAALLGSLSMFFLLRAIRNRNLFQLPVFRDWQQDHEWQVFAAACICLGFGSLTALVGLTSAIGSFAAGIFIGRMGAFHWLGSVLQPFKVFFTALFFVSIGVMIDMSYLRQHIVLMLLITLLMLLVNSLLSALVFRLLRMPWRSSVYAGALLSQTGEFGLLACTLAYHLAIINEDVYKASLVITGLSLLLSTIWMGIVRRHIHRAVRPLHAA